MMLLADHLRTNLPAILARRESEAPQGTTVEWDAPRVVPFQDGALTVFPAVEVVLTNDSVTGHEVMDDGSVRDLVTYSVRIFGTVHGPDFEGTDRARKRLVAAVKEALHAEDLPVAVARATRTSYSAVGAVRDKRTLAAAYIEAQITVLESPFTTDPAGTAGVEIHSIGLDVDVLDAPDD